MVKRAGIYTRLSSDPDGTSTATERQEQDCRELAAARGWTVAGVYQDNDTSAFKRGVKRPSFERMLIDMVAGELDVILAWRSDRLARQPRDLERVLDACEDAHATFVSCTEPEFQGSSGTLILRMLVNFAAHESGVKSERVKRAARERAEKGYPPTGGGRPFGYSADGMTLEPAEAGLIREAVARVLAGESIGAVATTWNEASVPHPAGGEHPWRTGNVKRILTSPRIAALRAYQGAVLGPGGLWPAIVDPDTWQRLQGALSRPGRQREARRYLLTGLAHCGRCGEPLVAAVRSRPARPYYYCRTKSLGGCDGVAIRAESCEEEVTERLFAVLAGPALDRLLAEADDDDGAATLDHLREDESALEQLAKDHYVEKMLSRPEYLAAREALEERVQGWRRELARSSSVLAGLPSGDEALRAHWTKRPLSWRRALLFAVIETVTVQSAGGRNVWNPERIEVRWRA